MIAQRTRPIRQREFRGNNYRLLFDCREPQVVLDGPAGTGKTSACLTKVHLLCEHVPGLRALICRKTRRSLTESVLATYEQEVVPGWVGTVFSSSHRANRHSYIYPNGSEIVLGGIDEPSRIMSSQWDVIYVPEAIELTEDEWGALDSRLRNNRLQYQQLLADTNPDRPTHWLRQAYLKQKLLMLPTTHQDNPAWWRDGEWTEKGQAYRARLEAIPGPRGQRLCHGKWVGSEGVVFPEFDPCVHLIDRFEIPNDWPRLWAIDFGYVNPFVWQAWALDHDNRLYRYREIYKTHRLVEDHARHILQLTKGEPRPVAIVCDHDAEGRATLERYLGLQTSAATKAVLAGIEAVAARLRTQGDGKARLYLLRDSLVERDQALDEAKKPCCLEEEMEGYVWATKGKEAPVKEGDHACDSTRYLVASLDLA